MSGLEFVTIFIDQLRDRVHSSTNQIPFCSGKYTDPTAPDFTLFVAAVEF